MSETALAMSNGGHMSSAELVAEVEEYFSLGLALRRGACVVDVGANIGAFALACTRRTEGDVRLVCVEPSTRLFATLSRNFADHPVLKRTQHALVDVAASSRGAEGRTHELAFFRRFPTDSTLELDAKYGEFDRFFAEKGRRFDRAIRGRFVDSRIARALGAVVALVLLHVPPSGFGRWLMRLYTGLERERCVARPVERIVADAGLPRVDVLKVDVEGHELEVLDGVGAAWPAVLQVVVEAQDAGDRVQAIRRLLETQGLCVVGVRPTAVAQDRGLQNVLIYARRES